MLLAASVCLASGTQAAEPDWGLKLTGLAGAPVSDGRARSARITFEPSLRVRGTDPELRAHLRLRWLDQQGERRSDVDVRELTLAWRGSDSTLAVGAQQVNWGRMDILRVTDVVNPIDQHDLFYQELPEAKLALWMMNWEWQRDANVVQIIVAPQVSVDRLPRRVAGLPVRTAKPATSMDTATYGLRYGFYGTAWNADLIAVRGRKTAPVLTPVLDAGAPHLRALTARQDSLGFSADRPLGGTVLRVEGLYARASAWDSTTGQVPGTQRQASLGVGLDIRKGGWFIAVQSIAEHNIDAVAGMPDRNAYVSAIIQREWLQDRLSTRALLIRDTHFGSSWASLQLSYELSHYAKLRVQADRFAGASASPFGALADRSRIAASVRIEF